MKKTFRSIAFATVAAVATLSSNARELSVSDLQIDSDLNPSGGTVTIVATVDDTAAEEPTRRAAIDAIHTFATGDDGVEETIVLNITAVDEGLNSIALPVSITGPALHVSGTNLKAFAPEEDLTNATRVLRFDFVSALAVGESLSLTLQRAHPSDPDNPAIPAVLFQSAPNISFSGQLRLQSNSDHPLRFVVNKADGLYPVFEYKDPRPYESAPTTFLFHRADYTLDLATEPFLNLPFVIHESGLLLEPGIDALSGTLKITGEVRHPDPKGIFLCDHSLRLREVPELSSGRLVRRPDGIFYLPDGTGPFALRLPVFLPSTATSGDASASLRFRPAPVRYLSRSGDTAHPLILELPGIGSFTDATVVFLPPSGSVPVSWRTAPGGEDAVAPSLYTASVVESLTIRPGLLIQNFSTTFDVRQGELTRVSLPLLGDGVVRSARGTHISRWDISEPDPETGRRLIEVEFRSPITGTTRIDFLVQQVLPAFPAEASPARIDYPDALRVFHQLRIATEGSVKARLEPADSVRQLTRSDRDSRLYEISRSPAPLSLLVEDVVPVIRANALILQHLRFSETVLEARFDLEIREAPLESVAFQIPPEYLVDAIETPALKDYRINPEGPAGSRLEIDFDRPIANPFSIQLKLKQPSPFQNQASTAFPSLRLLNAENLSGHLGIVADNGIAVSEDEISGLTPVAAAFFPAKVPGLALGYRLRDGDWSLITSLQVLPRTIIVEAAHLYHFQDEGLLGSSLLNLLVTGAPIESLTLDLPAGIIDPTFESPRISSWQREGERVEINFTRPASGAFPILVTWEESKNVGNALSPIGVQVVGASASRGYCFLLSHAPVSLAVTETAGSIFPITAGEIPADYRALFTAPLVGAFQYLDDTINLTVEASTNPPRPVASITIEKARFDSTVTREHNRRTVIDLEVKSVGADFLAFELPPSTRINSVRVDGTTTAPILDGNRRLIQLPRQSNADSHRNIIIEAISAGSPDQPAEIYLPQFSAPIVDGAWVISSEEGDSLRLLDASFLPTTHSPARSLLGANSILALIAAAIILLAGLGGALMGTRKEGLPGLIGKSAGILFTLLALAAVSLLLRDPTESNQGTRAEWSFSLPSISANTEMSVVVRSISTVSGWFDGWLQPAAVIAIFGYLIAFYLLPGIRTVIRRAPPVVAILILLATFALTPKGVHAEESFIAKPTETGETSTATHLEHSLSWTPERVHLETTVRWNPQRGEKIEFAPGTFRLVSTSVQTGSVLFVPTGNGFSIHASEDAATEIVLAFEQLDPSGRLTETVILPHTPTIVNRIHFSDLPANFDARAESEKLRFRPDDTHYLSVAAASTLTLVPSIATESADFTFTGTSSHALRPGLGGVETTSAYALEWRAGDPREFTFGIPAGLTIIGVEAGRERLRSWAAYDDGRRLRVALKPATETHAYIVLHGFHQSEDGITTTELPTPFNGDLLHGELAILVGPSEELQLAEVTDATPIRVSDIRLPQAAQRPIDASGIREAFRFEDLGKISVRTGVASVRPFIRLSERFEIALTEDRTRLSLLATFDVTRAGIFSIRAALPRGLEIESLTAPDVMTWDVFSSPSGQNELVVEFENAIKGSVPVRIEAFTEGVENRRAWEIPRISFFSVDRYEGQLAITFEPGLRLIPAQSNGTSPTENRITPHNAGVEQRQRFQLHDRNWRQSFTIETEQPLISAVVAERIHFSAGRIRVDANVALTVERAGIKSLRLALPNDFHSVRFGEDSEMGAVQVDEAANVWEIRFPNKLFGSSRFSLSYQSARNEDAGTIRMSPLVIDRASRQSSYLLLSSDPRFFIGDLADNEGVEALRADQIPAELFSTAELDQADRLVSIRDPSGPFEVPVERRDVEENVFAARVGDARIDTVVAPNGGLLHRLEMRVIPGSERFLELNLPADHVFWSAFVDGIPTDVWTHPERGLQIPVKLGIGSEATMVEIYYQRSDSGTRQTKRLDLATPTLAGSFERLDWYLSLPPGYDFDPDSIRDAFQLVSIHRSGSPIRYGISNTKPANERERAISKIAEGNQFLKQGRAEEAQQAFESAYNFSRNDIGLNRDAMTQWQNLRQQQAVQGISNTLRNVDGFNPAETRPTDLLESETATLAERLVARDSGGLRATDALRPQLPLEGKTIHLRRNLIVDGDQSITLSVDLDPPAAPTHRPPYLPLAILITTIALLETLRRHLRTT